MRELLQQVQTELQAFIDQDRDVLLIASCADADAALMLKMLRDAEQASNGDLFLLFADEFDDAASFVDVTIERLRAEHCLANESAAALGSVPLADLPEALFDETQPPAERMVQAMTFARSLLAPGKGQRLVWALFPQVIRDRAAYLRLLAALAPEADRLQPWMAGTRLVVRDEADTVAVAPHLARAPLTRYLPCDLGPDALAGSLCAEVEDETLPRARRMQALLGLAVLDYAYERYVEAVGKYNLLLGYYQETQDLAMQGLVLCGIGDIYQRQGMLEKARKWYEGAIDPASRGVAPVVFYTVVKNLGDVSFKQEDYARAEQYYDGAERLAAHLLDAEGKARALEWRGLSQERRRAYGEAVGSWEGSAELCRSLGMNEILRDLLEHLERVYVQHGLAERLPAVRAERRSLEQGRP